jgi:hypothetical protein
MTIDQSWLIDSLPDTLLLLHQSDHELRGYSDLDMLLVMERVGLLFGRVSFVSCFRLIFNFIFINEY